MTGVYIHSNQDLTWCVKIGVYGVLRASWAQITMAPRDRLFILYYIISLFDQRVFASHPSLRCFQRLSLSEQSPHHVVRNIRSLRLHLSIGPQGTPRRCIASTAFNHGKRSHCTKSGCIASTEVSLDQHRLYCINRGCTASEDVA